MMKQRLALVFLVWLAFASLLGSGLCRNWIDTWHLVGVNPLNEPFGDIRTIPDAVRLQSQHIDPYATTSRSMNYPRIWIALFSTFDLSDHLIAFELVIIALYLFCLSHLIISVASMKAAVFVFLGALSSVSFLAVERGNNDLIVFSLMYLGAQSAIPVIAVCLITIAALLKLYPMVAFLPRAIATGRQYWLFGVAGLSMIAYVLANSSDIAKIQRNTPHEFKQSYGVRSVTVGIEQLVHQSMLSVITGLFMLIFVSCLYFGWRLRIRAELSTSSTDQNLFAVFSSLFIATFLITPNYEYRLIFLIPLLPFYVRLLDQPLLRRLAVAALGLGLISIDTHLIHDFQALKVAGYLSRVALFFINSLFAGWVFKDYLVTRRSIVIDTSNPRSLTS